MFHYPVVSGFQSGFLAWKLIDLNFKKIEAICETKEPILNFTRVAVTKVRKRQQVSYNKATVRKRGCAGNLALRK